MRFNQLIEILNPPQEEIDRYPLATARRKYDMPEIHAATEPEADGTPDSWCDDAARIDRAIAALGGDELINWDNKHEMPDLTAKWMLTALDAGVDALYRAILDCPEIALSVRVRLVAAIAERVAE